MSSDDRSTETGSSKDRQPMTMDEMRNLVSAIHVVGALRALFVPIGREMGWEALREVFDKIYAEETGNRRPGDPDSKSGGE